ncbi:hypothetical protein OEG86_04485 [Hoeflea alexandrii]|uniref:hypothetical protein n=1 Tax=Hoeflea alexandrii TaxID=288436 RepID=UPI00226E8B43|nr:hypothetical protein [Hoeflea alexandrii]MCY0151617.1 hypothetical protein [Hoeflea alexandrii]
MSTAEPAKVIKTAGTSAKTGVRRASSEKAPPESAGPVSGTPRVMMPAELAGYSAAQATKPVLVAKSGATTITRSSAPLVPLPSRSRQVVGLLLFREPTCGLPAKESR